MMETQAVMFKNLCNKIEIEFIGAKLDFEEYIKWLKKYIKWLEKTNAIDTLGSRIYYLRKLVNNQCLDLYMQKK